MNIIQEFAWRMEHRQFEMTAKLSQGIDFNSIEAELNQACAQLNAALQQALLQQLLREERFLRLLKIYAGRCGMRLKGYRSIMLTLSNGQRIAIDSPYFIKTQRQRRRKKHGPNGSGAHIGLKVLGFIGRVSPGLLSDAVQTALLCPSYEVAHTVLKGRGIVLDVKTLRRLCQLAGNVDASMRGALALSGHEYLHDYTLVVSIDGGRLRERRRKRGRKPNELKRQGYHTDWREPKLFTLYLLERTGKVVKAFRPLYDATLGNHEALFALLERYWCNLPLEQLARIVFCGDGGPWIWHGVEALCQRMGLDKQRVYQVLDYTHAQQNLNEIVALMSPAKQADTRAKWKSLLWNGSLNALQRSIENTITHKAKREQAMSTFTRYFITHQQRMCYAWFKAQGLPCGSGHVESAIRRVINLRLKAPGTFWLREMAECFLFLRAQLLSGRWDFFLANLTALTRRAFWPVYTVYQETWKLLKAA